MKKILSLSLFLFLSLGLSAQTINLEQARLLALANSRTLVRHEIEIRNSVLSERDQLYNMLPQISAGYRAEMSFLRDWEFINPVDTLTGSVNLTLTQIIFQGGKGFLERSIRSINTESARKEALAAYFNELDTIDNAYYTVLEAGAALEAEESSLQAANLSLSIAEIRIANGMINQGDYLRALADKESRENSRNQAQRNLTLNLNRFRNLLGIRDAVYPEPISFDVYEDVFQRLAGISDDDAEALYEKFWNLLTASNPSIAIASLNSRRAQLNHSSIARDYAPTISARVSSDILEYSRADGFNSNPGSNGRITISGTIPIDFWVLSDRVERSRTNRDFTLRDYAYTESSMEQDLLTALSNLFTQAGSVLSSRRSLEYTERHYEYVLERFRLLQSSVSEMNDASGLLINSRNSNNRASYAFLQSLSRLRSLCAINDEEKLLGILLN